mmetsp:Transcript_25584/g.80072  ORF Transcript_25584/g.80072 Transcript_25584/m.80072 type:complete len:196 (-) Transcript_25584:290-877(-)
MMRSALAAAAAALIVAAADARMVAMKPGSFVGDDIVHYVIGRSVDHACLKFSLGSAIYMHESEDKCTAEGFPATTDNVFAMYEVTSEDSLTQTYVSDAIECKVPYEVKSTFNVKAFALEGMQKPTVLLEERVNSCEYTFTVVAPPTFFAEEEPKDSEPVVCEMDSDCPSGSSCNVVKPVSLLRGAAKPAKGLCVL